MKKSCLIINDTPSSTILKRQWLVWHFVTGKLNKRYQPMRTSINHPEHINSEEGQRLYGDVAFSDTTTTPSSEHTRTLWCSIHHWENAYTFSSENPEVSKPGISQAADQSDLIRKK